MAEITLDLIERWRRCDPQAEKELLFEHLDFDAHRRQLYSYGRGFYRRLRKTNPWLPEEIERSVVDIESHALGALLQALEELKRREEGPKSVEEFLNALDIQPKRRLKDLLIEEAKRLQGTRSLDIPPDDEAEGIENGETPLERLVGEPVSQIDPHLQEMLDMLLESLLENFYQNLRRQRALHKHYDALKSAFACCYPTEERLSLLARIFEFLRLTETKKHLQKGRQHEEELAQHVIPGCCQQRNTYDTHNYRLRIEWRKFLNEDGRKDFERLSGLRR